MTGSQDQYHLREVMRAFFNWNQINISYILSLEKKWLNVLHHLDR